MRFGSVTFQSAFTVSEAHKIAETHYRTSSELHLSMTLSWVEEVCLYRGRPPPLAADATEVERPHLHLHEGNRELMTFPVVPVDTL